MLTSLFDEKREEPDESRWPVFSIVTFSHVYDMADSDDAGQNEPALSSDLYNKHNVCFQSSLQNDGQQKPNIMNNWVDDSSKSC